MQVEGHIGKNQLPAYPKPAPESIGPVGTANKVGGDRFTGLRIASKGGEHFGIMHPLFEHLRGCFDEVTLEVAAEARPLLLPLKDPMHQVAEFVKEGGDVVVLQQAGIVRFPARKVADNRYLGQLFAALAIEYRVGTEPLIFARPGMHIEVDAAELTLPIKNVED